MVPSTEQSKYPRLWDENVVIYQHLDPRGTYPRFSILTEDHSFFSSGDLVWSAVVQPPVRMEPWDHPELYTLTPEEIRLYSAVVLAEPNPFDRGYVSPVYHRGTVARILDLPGPLDSPEFAEFMDERRPKSLRYELHNAGTGQEALEALNAFDSSDELLVAGAGRLLSSLRLASADFGEEAHYQAFVSMGAAMEFIRLHLEFRDGVASMKSVYQYFEQTFPFGNHFPEFLEQMYDDRVAAFHPSSRLGEYWAPPVWTGSDYELRKWLLEIYRHIILGAIPNVQS